MKIKFRFGNPHYWDKKEKWQRRAIMNILGLAVLSVIMLLNMAQKNNVRGAITFGIFMFLYTAPQIYQYEKWYRRDARKKAGLEVNKR